MILQRWTEWNIDLLRFCGLSSIWRMDPDKRVEESNRIRECARGIPMVVAPSVLRSPSYSASNRTALTCRFVRIVLWSRVSELLSEVGGETRAGREGGVATASCRSVQLNSPQLQGRVLDLVQGRQGSSPWEPTLASSRAKRNKILRMQCKIWVWAGGTYCCGGGGGELEQPPSGDSYGAIFHDISVGWRYLG